MVSSLEIGNIGRARQLLPGSSSPYLTVSSEGAPMASSDLGVLMNAHRGGVQYVTPHAETPVLRPTRAVGTLAFDVQRVSDSRFTETTINKMHEAVLAAKTDAQWRELMEKIRDAGRRAGAIGWKDYLGEVRWFDHFYRNIHPIDYVRDPHQVEMVMHPWLTFQKQGGDCDDSSSLTAASLSSLGAPYRFRSYRADPRRPQEDSHVAAQIFVPQHDWVNIDLTLKDVDFGFEPKGFQFRDWPEPKR